MKLRIFSGGLLIGVAIGMMIGGAVVQISADGTGTRQYPQGVSLLLGLVGAIGVGSTLRMPARSPHQE